MTEHSGNSVVSTDGQTVCTTVYKVANMIQVSGSNPDSFMFAAKTVASQTDVLLTIELTDKNAKVIVNCEKMVIGSMLVKNIKTALGKL